MINIKSVSGGSVCLQPALFPPFLSSLYTRVYIMRSPKEARRRYLAWRKNLDFTGGDVNKHWFEGPTS